MLDLSRVLAGPYCAMLLGDLGADVVKVEHPDHGDDTRAWGPPFVGGESAYYLSVNRNKRSLALDLKHPDARPVLSDLIAAADVLVENFRPGGLARLGFDPAAIEQRNPRLIHCSITGWGSRGPWADRPGYDFIIQAAAGLMGITGEPDGQPVKVGVAIVDIVTGLYAFGAIAAALYGRQVTGRGQRIEVSLFEAAAACLINVGQNHLATGAPAGRYGNAHANIVPYQAFRTADGWIAVAAATDEQFAKLCRALGVPELARDARFATNAGRVRHRDGLIPILAGRFLGRSTAAWEEVLAAADVPAARVNAVHEVFTHPQALALDLVAQVDHPAAGRLPFVRNPLHLDGQFPPARRPPPLLGEHTEQILSELGYRFERLAELRRAGVIRRPQPPSRRTEP